MVSNLGHQQSSIAGQTRKSQFESVKAVHKALNNGFKFRQNQNTIIQKLKWIGQRIGVDSLELGENEELPRKLKIKSY